MTQHQQASLNDTISELLGYLNSDSGTASIPAFTEDLHRYGAVMAYLGLPYDFMRISDGHIFLNEYQTEFVRTHLQIAQEATENLRNMQDCPESPMFNLFGHGVPTVLHDTQGQPQLTKLLQQTHMLAVTRGDEKTYDKVYATCFSRGEVVEAIGLVRPALAEKISNRMELEGLDPHGIGRIPMLPDEIKQFQDVYAIVLRAYIHQGPEAAEKRIDATRTASMGKTKQGTHNGHSGVTTTVSYSEGVKPPVRPASLKSMPGADREKSVNDFLLPLEVLNPVRDTMRRIEKAQKPDNDGLHEKLRRNPPEVWIAYGDRALMVNRAKQLAELIKAQPEAQQNQLQCVTIYDRRDSKKNHEVRQSVNAATNEPALDKKTKDSVIIHNPEYWLAVPYDLLAAVGREQADFRELRDAAAESFKQAITLPDEHARKAGIEAANADLQAILDDYSERKVLAGTHEVNALRAQQTANAEKVRA